MAPDLRLRAYFLSRADYSPSGPMPAKDPRVPGLPERYRPARRQTFGSHVPALAAVAGHEDASVLGADDHRRSMGRETAGVHVVGEPFRKADLAALEASVILERSAVHGRPPAMVTRRR